MLISLYILLRPEEDKDELEESGFSKENGIDEDVEDQPEGATALRKSPQPLRHQHSARETTHNSAHTSHGAPQAIPKRKMQSSLSVSSATASPSPSVSPSTSPTKKSLSKPEGVSRPPPPRPVPPRPSFPPNTHAHSSPEELKKPLPETVGMSSENSMPTPPLRKKRAQKQKTMEQGSEPATLPSDSLPPYSSVIQNGSSSVVVQAPPTKPGRPSRPPRPTPRTT